MNISFLLNLLGYLGLGLVLLGAGRAAQLFLRGRLARGYIWLAIGGLILMGIRQVASQGVLALKPNEVAVIFNTDTGDFSPPRYGGLGLISPVSQQATVYDISQQNYTMVNATNAQDAAAGVQGDDSIQGRTIDGQDVWVGVTILYSVDPNAETLNNLHIRWGENYQLNFIRPTTRSIIRDVVSRYRASELYSELRVEMEGEIESLVAAILTREGFILTDFLVRGIRFSEQFTQAVENKLQAEQEALEASFQVQREQQLAEQQRVRARGVADSTIFQAQAEALRLVSQQIASNPALIQYLYVQNLSDNVDVLALVPSNSPFLFDFDALMQQTNPDFVAPVVPQSSIAPEGTPEAAPAQEGGG